MVLRRSRRLAAKPAVNYYEAPEPSEAAQRLRDKRQAARGGLSWPAFVTAVRAELGCTVKQAWREASKRQAGLPTMTREELAAERFSEVGRRVQARSEAAVARQEAAMRRRAERIVARMERDAAVLAAMPLAPPCLERQDAVTELPHGPALERTEATGCQLPEEVLNLPPPPPLRRTCQLPGCDEWCTYCRENDRIAAANRGWNPFQEPRPAFVPQLAFDLPPPPIGATVVRIPIDMRLMTAAALREIIAAANAALNA